MLTCLNSVPINTAVATRFVDYLTETFQYQSTLAYLKDPLPGYQQPAVDVLSRLSEIKSNVGLGAYENEYAFEVDVQRLIHAFHDGHVNLFSGILFPFTFGSPVDIVSVSADGKSPPALYLRGILTARVDAH